MQTKRIIILLITVTLTLSGCAYHAELVRAPDTSLYNQYIMFNNVQYIPLLSFCNYYNLDWDWDLVSQRIEVKKDNYTIVLKPNSKLAVVNNNPVKLGYPIEYKNGTAYIAVKTAIFVSKDIFKLSAQPRPVEKLYQIKTVVIDPGHGGKDPGAKSAYGTKEKDIVLDVSKRLKRHLEKEGLRILLTRDEDVFIPLYKRAEFASRKNADLFISVHANASRHSVARGFEVYYLSEATDDNARALAVAENASLKFEEGPARGDKDFLSMDPTVWDLVLSENRQVSKELAYYICNITSDSLDMKKRGAKGARFAVLKNAMMPAVLVEIGFLTNRREESKLTKSSFREEIAGAISRSILAYKREYERTDGFTE